MPITVVAGSDLRRMAFVSPGRSRNSSRTVRSSERTVLSLSCNEKKSSDLNVLSFLSSYTRTTIGAGRRLSSGFTSFAATIDRSSRVGSFDAWGSGLLLVHAPSMTTSPHATCLRMTGAIASLNRRIRPEAEMLKDERGSATPTGCATCRGNPRSRLRLLVALDVVACRHCATATALLVLHHVFLLDLCERQADCLAHSEIIVSARRRHAGDDHVRHRQLEVFERVAAGLAHDEHGLVDVLASQAILHQVRTRAIYEVIEGQIFAVALPTTAP